MKTQLLELTSNLSAIEILEKKGFDPIEYTLPYCTPNGIEYFIGFNDNKAAICALINDDDNCIITKGELREMSLTASYKGVIDITLFTNYGLELHSRYDKPSNVGLNRIIKLTRNIY